MKSGEFGMIWTCFEDENSKVWRHYAISGQNMTHILSDFASSCGFTEFCRSTQFLEENPGLSVCLFVWGFLVSQKGDQGCFLEA